MLRALIGVKYDTIPFIRKYFLFVTAKIRNTHDMESCKEADNCENVELPQESLKNTAFEHTGAQELQLNRFPTRIKTRNTMLLQ